MPDPFEALRTPPTPIEPDRAFAARLRARVLRKLQGDQSMTLQTSETSDQTDDRLRQGDISYVGLWVANVERAARFYSSVLGWRYAPAGGGDNSLQVEGLPTQQGLAELEGAGQFMRRLGVPLPPTLSSTAYLVFVVDNLEASIASVRAAGGWAGEPSNQPYGRAAAAVDPQGMPFSLHEVPAGMPAPRPNPRVARPGDLAFLMFEVPNAARARAFFESALGLRFAPGRGEDDWNISEIVPMSGLSGGHARVTIVPMYSVEDIHAAVERVRAGGGTATEPLVEPYGMRADCTDDQGTRFMLGQF